MSQAKYTKKGLNGRQSDQAEFFFGNNSFSGTDMVATMTISGTENTNGSHVLGSIQTLSYSIHQEKQPIRSIGNVNAKDYVMGPRTIAGSLVFAVFDRHFAYAAMGDIKREYKNYHFLADELPPFDITITYANEYGANSKLALYGVRLVNEGQVMSINDIYTENTYQFVATDIDYLDTQNLTDSILNKNMFNEYTPDALNVSPNLEDYMPNLEEEVETEEEVIEAVNYELEVKNITPYFYDRGVYGSADVYLTPQPKEKCNLKIKAFDNDFKEQNIELLPDSVFPINFKDLKPGRYELFVNGYYGLAVHKHFAISTVKYDGDKEFAATFMIYEKGDKDGYCYVRCESTQVLDGLEYIKKSEYEATPNAKWISVDSAEAKRHFLLNKLLSETTYLLRGLRDKQIVTQSIEFTTTKLSTIFDKHDYLKEYLKYNAPAFNTKTSIYDSIIDAAKEYAKDKEHMTIAEAIWAIKDDSNMAYIDYCIMMTMAYENQILWATSETINPPVLFSAAQSAILIDQDTDCIEIEKIGYCPSTVTSNQFDKLFDKWIYRLPGSEGLYRIKRFNNNSKLSVPMMVAVFNQKYREKLLSTETMTAKAKEQSINRTKSQVLEQLKHLSEAERDLAILEYAQESNHFSTGIMQPVMIEHTDRHVAFIHPVETFSSLYCCIQRTDELLANKPLHKKLVTSANQYFASFDILDQGLMKDVRYSVWYETADFNKVSPVFSFYFDQEEDEILTAKNKILIKTLYSMVRRYSAGQSNELLYEYACNKIIDLDASLYSHYGEIYDKLIMDIYTNKDLSKRDTYLLLYYMLEIFMAVNHENQVTYLAETHYYPKENSLVISPREAVVIHRVVISPSGMTKLPLMTKDSAYVLDLGFIRDHGNLGLIYYTTTDGKLISKPLVVDYDHQTKIYGTYKER